MNTNNYSKCTDKEEEKEPVLLVPPSVTKKAYTILVDHNCVARKWHVGGRYGSRTHPFTNCSGCRRDGMDGTKIGIPLLKTPETIDVIISVLLERDYSLEHTLKVDSTIKSNNVEVDKTSLRELLFVPGVELIYENPFISNKIPKEEPFNATIHPNRIPQNFASKMLDFLEGIKREEVDENTNKHHLIPNSSSTLQPPLLPPKPSFTFCELFSGIGGFGIALEALGGKCVFASDIYEPSKRIYCSNLDTQHLHNKVVSGDIWKINSKDIPNHDLLVGGFPCQSFSRLGDQPGLSDAKVTTGRRNIVNSNDDSVFKKSDDNSSGRGMLFTQIVRILRDCQPRAFLLENVPGLISTDNGNALDTIISALEVVGYDVSKEVCSSRGLTSQSRKRLYIVGIKRVLEDEVRQNDSSSTSEATSFQFPFIPDLKLRAIDIVHTNEELNQTLFSGTGVPIELMRHATPATLFRLSDAQMNQLLNRSKYWKPAKLAWDDTTIATITSHYGSSVGKGNSQLVPSPAPHRPRRFTPRECARIMGFSDSFSLGEYYPEHNTTSQSSNTQVAFNTFIKEQYFVLGNAVCPPLIAALAGAILEHCSITILPQQNYIDYIDAGIWVAIKLALEAVAPCQRATVRERWYRAFHS